MAIAPPKPTADTHGEHVAPGRHGDSEPDTLAQTAPLIMIWLPMLLVVGLVILAGVTTSHYALAGAILALLLMTFAVVEGTVRLASLPPADGDEEDERELQA